MTAATTTRAMRIHEGVELLGPYAGSGHHEPPYLVRRADGKTCLLSPLLQAVLSRCDGRTLPVLAEQVSAEIGRPLSPGDVVYLLEHKLAPLGLLEGTEPVRPAGILASPLLSLWFRVPLMPARWVVAISNRLQPLFAPAVIAVALATLVAVDMWLFGVKGIGEVLRSVLDAPLALALVTPLTLLGACFHELGHATACRKGGAKPGVIGVGLYLWWLVMFNDLTDTYRLDRRGRLRADLGGIYFNVVFILVSVAAYAATGFVPLLVVAVVAHAEIVVQFWPFVRLDGYYVISDLTGVPDLFPLVRPVLRSTLRRRPEPAVAALRPQVRRAVTSWVLLTVAALGAGLVWLAFAGPPLAAEALDALGRQIDEVSVTWRAGGPGSIAVAVFELALLLIPVLGSVLTALLVIVSGGRWLIRRTRRTDRFRRARRPSRPSRSGPTSPQEMYRAGGISERDWDAVAAGTLGGLRRASR